MFKKLIVCVLFLSSIASASKMTGTVKVDGSSTVFPITEAVAEDFRMVQPKVRVTVGVSGTGGGFKKFVAGEIDINDASREIKKSEISKAQTKKIDYLEVPVAYDGISIVVNKRNTWVNELTVDELHKIWKPGSTVKLWSDIRAEWPKEKIRLYGPGTDSGTFDYFTKAVNGKSHVSRSDYTKSEDDNVLVQGVAGNKNSLGFFGFAYYIENQNKLKVVPIKETKKSKAIAPSVASISDGSYKPLSRKIYIYVNKKSLMKPQVTEFVKFYLNNAKKLSQEVGYVGLATKDYQASLMQVAKARK